MYQVLCEHFRQVSLVPDDTDTSTSEHQTSCNHHDIPALTLGDVMQQLMSLGLELTRLDTNITILHMNVSKTCLGYYFVM